MIVIVKRQSCVFGQVTTDGEDKQKRAMVPNSCWVKSVNLHPQHTHIPRPIEALEKDPFCPPYPQSSLLKWLP